MGPDRRCVVGPLPDLHGAGRPAGRPRRRPRLHPCRTAPGDGAPVLRIVGVPVDGVLLPDRPARHARRPQGDDRPSAPAWRGGDPRLGAVALRDRRRRARELRRHSPLRARRSSSGPPSRLGERDLQLRPQRSPGLPRVECHLLARALPRRRPAGRCRRVDAVPRLLPQRGRVGPERRGWTHQPRGGALPPAVQRRRARGVPRCPDDRRGVDGVARGDGIDVAGRPRVRPEVGHGVDARHPGVPLPRTRPPAVASQRSDVPLDVRAHGAVRAPALPRRGGARQGVAPRQATGRRVAAVRQPPGALRAAVDDPGGAAPVHGRRVGGRPRVGPRVDPRLVAARCPRSRGRPPVGGRAERGAE